ncbi:MAG: class I poly(R)-hydroxyalkanoic acid synthase [Hyphomonadaceae bacterium]
MSSKSGNSTDNGGPPSLAKLIAEQDPAKVQALLGVMAAANQESHALLSDVLGNAMSQGGRKTADPFAAAQSFQKVSQSLYADPMLLMKANSELWQGMMTAWMDVNSRKGNQSKSKDRRFSDPEWSGNPMFGMLQRSYELNSKWMMTLIDGVQGVSDADRRKAKFFAQQTLDACAPTNFFATNPQALRRMIETGGQSVLDGLKQARADLRKGNGKLTISQTDESVFKLGENVATAEGKVVFRNDLIELLQFEASTDTVYKRPLLIFPPWINKYYILDLREENSMIRWLRDKGYSVFVVSWRSADDVTKDFTWDDYVEHGAYAAVEATLKAADAKNLNAVGYCIGGTMLTSAMAHMAKNGDKRIKSASYFASQMDFEQAGDLLVFTDEHAFGQIDTLIKQNDGLMPGESMGETFNWLRPVDLVWRYVIDNYMLGKKPRPFDLLYWNADQTNIPGPTHRTYLQDLYANNALASGKFKVLGETVNVRDIEIPVHVQASRDDHICPYSSVYRTAKSFSGPSRFVLSGSGHIAGVVNHPDANKYEHWINKELPDTADEWIEGAEEIKGSWWPAWHKWLKKKSGKKIPARKLPKKTYGDAPGTYVRRRLEHIRSERGLD